VTSNPAEPPDAPDPAPPDPAPPDPAPPAALWRLVVAPKGPATTTRDHEAVPGGRRTPPGDAAGRGGRRRLGAVCLALLAGAAALETAARLAWFTAGVDAVGRGTVVVTATGADLVPGLTGVALLAVAAVAATVALGGPARRVLGGLVVVAGGWVAVTVARLLVAPPTPADVAALPGAPTGGNPVPGSATLHAGPLPAALGAVVLVAAGAALVVAERRLPRLGARYTARPVAEPVLAADPDRAAWEALDAGRDPTVDHSTATGPGRTDDGPRGRPV
jgi:uncharacterized membrane protein (TIGR02234 family)